MTYSYHSGAILHQDTLRFALLCDPCSCQHQLNRRTPQILPIFKHSALQLFSSLPSSLFRLVPLSPTKLDQNDPSHSYSWPTSQPSNHRSPEMMRSFNRSDRTMHALKRQSQFTSIRLNRSP
ncbi:Dual specificity protein kinase KNS1 [Fusarium oxysporum f. sp. albedinis]|nr:Dual specificity protein kinase KNS1 [Fusarium oxysporum f. sp. albedinis]